jgi:hypothetical protein
MSEYKLEDGRKAIKLENNVDSLTKVIEVYVEPKPEKKLKQRITEKLGVVERVIETLDEKTGKVIDRVVEKVCGEPVAEKKMGLKSPMQLVVEDKIGSKVDFKNYILMAVIAAQVLVLGYVLFM